MKIQVSGQHINIGASLQEYVKQRIEVIVSKYFNIVVSAGINFTKQNYLFECQLMINEGSGRKVVIKSTATADDIYVSFDMALAKVEKQLRRYKSKLQNKDKLNTSDALNSMQAIKYVINSRYEEDKEPEEAPVIIAEKPTEIHHLSVSEAVMKMDLENLPALLFKNVKTGNISVVYYRKDGNISWVETK